jgi:hypothetical protein
MKTVLIAICVASTALTTRGSLLATDNAGNYSSWNNSDNQGSGFGAWSLSGSANSGFFIGNSADNAGGSSGNINSSGNKAWGLYANSSATASAIRPFTGGSLAAGQQFLIQMDNGYLQSGGTVGFGLQNGSGVNRFEFYFVGGSSSYTINIGGTTTSTGIGFTGNGLSLAFSQNASDGYSLDITPAGGSVSHFSGTLAASDISQLRLFNFDAGSGGNNDAFFNNIQVVPEPVNVALGFFGAIAAGSIGVRRFLSRKIN